jgi:hypothetical protein
VTVTAGPAAACSCFAGDSEPKRAARSDAIFVGDAGWRRAGRPVGLSPKTRSGTFSVPAPVVFTFEVSRVYKGAVGERQEIVTPEAARPAARGSGSGFAGRGRSWCSRIKGRMPSTSSVPASMARQGALDHGYCPTANRPSVGCRLVSWTAGLPWLAS